MKKIWEKISCENAPITQSFCVEFPRSWFLSVLLGSAHSWRHRLSANQSGRTKSLNDLKESQEIFKMAYHNLKKSDWLQYSVAICKVILFLYLSVIGRKKITPTDNNNNNANTSNNDNITNLLWWHKVIITFYSIISS